MDLWTKYYYAVKEHPKTIQLASLLGIRRAEACGLLANLWAWAVNAGIDSNGDISMFRGTRIEKECAWEGEPRAFIKALFSCGWLDGSFADDTAHIHDWAEYGGALAAEKERAAERKRKQRQSQRLSRGQSQGQSQCIDKESDKESEKEKDHYHYNVNRSIGQCQDIPGRGNPVRVIEYFEKRYPEKTPPPAGTVVEWIQRYGMSEKALYWMIDQTPVDAHNPAGYVVECVRDKASRNLFTYDAIMKAEEQREKQ